MLCSTHTYQLQHFRTFKIWKNQIHFFCSTLMYRDHKEFDRSPNQTATPIFRQQHLKIYYIPLAVKCLKMALLEGWISVLENIDFSPLCDVQRPLGIRLKIFFPLQLACSTPKSKKICSTSYSLKEHFGYSGRKGIFKETPNKKHRLKIKT